MDYIFQVLGQSCTVLTITTTFQHLAWHAKKNNLSNLVILQLLKIKKKTFFWVGWEVQHYLISSRLSFQNKKSQSSFAIKGESHYSASCWGVMMMEILSSAQPWVEWKHSHIPLWLQECWLARTARTMWKWVVEKKWGGRVTTNESSDSFLLNAWLETYHLLLLSTSTTD